MIRVHAPLEMEEMTQMVLKTTLASDPTKTQYEMARKCDRQAAERYSFFTVWDPEWGSWPLSASQRQILKDVCAKVNDEWIVNTLLQLTKLEEDTTADVDTDAASPTTTATSARGCCDASEAHPTPSLRLIDWFVTNYSKSKAIAINGCSVYSSYITCRKAYQCRNFDPFRRNLKLSYRVAKSDADASHASDTYEWHTTTVGQLNFLLWADLNGVLRYVYDHQADIEVDMAKVCRRVRRQRQLERKTGQKKRKRSTLSKQSYVPCRIVDASASHLHYDD